MNKHVKITKEDTLLFIERISNGMTAVQAAKLASLSVTGLEKAVIRYKLKKTKRKTLREKILERKEEIENSDKSQHWWAKELGGAQSAVCILFKELNINRGRNAGLKGRADDRAKRYEDYRQILTHIMQNGGCTPNAIKDLDLNINKHEFRCFAKSIGINLNEWQFAWRRYGSWLALPGPFEVRPPVNYIVPAVCLSCGKHTMLNLNNAKTEKTSTCVDCSKRTKPPQKVRNITTGEEYQSVMGWAKALGMVRNYQTLRLRIRMQAELTIDGFTYSLINTEDEDP